MFAANHVILDKYRIRTLIGDGGMSYVYLAENVQNQENVVVKVLKEAGVSRKDKDHLRFKNEAALIARFSHPHLVKVLEVGELEGKCPYLVMEYVQGEGLDKLLAKGYVFTCEEVLNIAMQIARTLDYVHKQKIIHCDLKPGNILFTLTPNNSFSVKLIDFGVARIVELTEIKGQEQIEGTFSYMSPEQCGIIKRPLGVRSDLYSLGVVMYQLLTGQLPFKGKSIWSIIHQQIAKNPDPPSCYNPYISVRLERVVLKLLEKEPARRYKNASLLLTDLAACLEEEKNRAFGEQTQPYKPPYKTRLVGRDEELNKLKTLHQATLGNRGQTCFIYGEAGTGKTRLIVELCRYIRTHTGASIYGACFSDSHKLPYGVFKEALDMYLNVFKKYPRAKKRRIKKRIADSLGPLSGFLLKLSPKLKYLLVSPSGSPPPELDWEKENRFFLTAVNLLFQSLGQEEGALALLLDDLQWVDNGSLEVLKELMMNQGQSPLLIAGTYRTEEVTEEHILKKLLFNLRQQGFSCDSIHLDCFDIYRMSELVANLLYGISNNLPVVADFIFKKSKGNIFFAKELVLQLINQNILTYTQTDWQLNQRLLSGIKIPLRLLDIVLKRTEILKEEEKNLLAFAAAIGSNFDLELLTQLCSSLQVEVMATVEKARELQLLEEHFSEKNKLSFVHDRIREAFLTSLDEKRKRQIHLQIAQVLEKREKIRPLLLKTPQSGTGAGCSSSEANEGCQNRNNEHIIFELAYHYHQAGEKEKTLQYSYPAGLFAKHTYANEEAIKYLTIAKDIIDETGREGDKTWKAIYKELGELYGITGNYELAIQLLSALLPFEQSEFPKAVIYKQLCEYYFKKGDWESCEKYGSTGLHLLGERLPLNSFQVVTSITVEIAKRFFYTISARIKSTALFNHLNQTFGRSKSTNKKQKTKNKCKIICGFYMSLRWLYVFSDSSKFTRSALRMLNIAESKIGKSKELAVSMGTFAGLHTFLPVFKKALAFHLKALALSKELKDHRGVGQSYQLLGFHYEWAGMFRESIKYYKKSISLFKKFGDLREISLSLNGLWKSYYQLAAYQKAKQIARERYRIIQKTKNNFEKSSFECNNMIYYLEKGLFKKAYKLGLATNHFSREHKFWLTCCVSHLNLGILHLERGKAGLAVEYLEKARAIYKKNKLMRPYTVHLFAYLAEACLQSYVKRGKYSLGKVKRLCREAYNKLKPWPVHYGLALRLMAKYYTITHCFKKARHFFVAGIRHHKKLKKRYELAKTYYEYGLFLKEHNSISKARYYWELAHNLFNKIGARAYRKKTAALLGVRESENIQDRLIEKHRLSSIIRVGQDISSLLNLNELLENIMLKAIEVTGAQRGYLFLLNETTKRLELKASRSLNYYNSSQYSTHVVDEVLHEKKTIITLNAAEDKIYAHYPSVVKYGLKSILAVPLLRFNKVMGVCYLDNPLSRGVFTEEDGALLNVFMTQAAIAIENAYLYQNLENKVKERTEELKTAKDSAEKASRAKSEFLTNVSHEIRTPLNGILGFAEIIKETKLSVESLKYSKLIIAETEKLLELINQLLDISKIEKGKCVIASQPFDFYEIVNSLSSTLGELARRKGLTFAAIIDKNIPATLKGDALRLRQVLINLIGNAIKFTEQGRIFFKVKAIAETDTTIDLYCRVEDTGIGIPQDKQPHIFEIFEQAESSISRKYRGTGLGLAISKQLIELMQGEVGLESEAGKGSTFWFKLRLEKCPALTSDQPAVRLATDRKHSDKPVYNLACKKVLVAEDYEISQELMRYQLTKAGCIVTIAGNGQEVLQLLGNQSFDLIFMDVQMPVMDGYETTRLIRSLPPGSGTQGQTVPVIGLTASGFANDIEQCYSAGMDDVVIKPIRRDILLKKMVYWLEKKPPCSSLSCTAAKES